MKPSKKPYLNVITFKPVNWDDKPRGIAVRQKATECDMATKCEHSVQRGLHAGKSPMLHYGLLAEQGPKCTVHSSRRPPHSCWLLTINRSGASQASEGASQGAEAELWRIWKRGGTLANKHPLEFRGHYTLHHTSAAKLLSSLRRGFTQKY